MFPCRVHSSQCTERQRMATVRATASAMGIGQWEREREREQERQREEEREAERERLLSDKRALRARSLQTFADQTKE